MILVCLIKKLSYGWNIRCENHVETKMEFESWSTCNFSVFITIFLSTNTSSKISGSGAAMRLIWEKCGKFFLISLYLFTLGVSCHHLLHHCVFFLVLLLFSACDLNPSSALKKTLSSSTDIQYSHPIYIYPVFSHF